MKNPPSLENNYKKTVVIIEQANKVQLLCTTIYICNRYMAPYKKNNTIQQFQAVFNYATIGIVVSDRQGTIINFNKCAESQFGYTKEEICGRHVEELIPTKFQHSHTKHRDQYFKHPEPRSMGAGRDLFARRKDDSVFPVEVSLSHYVLDGETFAIAFVIDITVRKASESTVLSQKEELEQITRRVMGFNTELEQKVEDRTKMLRETLAELERSKAELSEALKSEKELGDLKSGFVTLASHEFRTPLSTILSSTYLLEQYSGENEKTGKHIQRIKNAVSGMKSILEDFLSLGKLEEGLIQIKKETIHSDELWKDIKSLIEEMEQMLKHGQKIKFLCQGDHYVMVDRNLLKNILTNLVSNAIKFSPEKSVIEINCALSENNLVILVKDSGIGISEEDQQRLFQRFFRATNAGNVQGTGLGLHIVKKYLELIGGSIEMKSSINKGSTFILDIPSTYNES